MVFLFDFYLVFFGGEGRGRNVWEIIIPLSCERVLPGSLRLRCSGLGSPQSLIAPSLVFGGRPTTWLHFCVSIGGLRTHVRAAALRIRFSFFVCLFWGLACCCALGDLGSEHRPAIWGFACHVYSSRYVSRPCIDACRFAYVAILVIE
jgi:hypothetical protein